MSHVPEISVIVPARNNGNLLRACLASLTMQDMDPGKYEIVVCDDGSTEDISSVVSEFQQQPPVVRSVRQGAMGPASARNMGFRSSAAPIYVCLDSDMTCEPHFVSLLVQALRANPSWVAVQGHVAPAGGNDSPLWDAPASEKCSFLSGATAYRAEALRLVGGFDETFPYPANEDFELGIRLSRIGTFGYVPEAVAYHPRRKVTLRTFWKWRTFWRFTVIIANRYGVFGVPSSGKRTRYPRLRTAFSAVITLPTGRLIQAVRYAIRHPVCGTRAIFHAVFDYFCGLCALPDIMFCRMPARKDYLARGVKQ